MVWSITYGIKLLGKGISNIGLLDKPLFIEVTAVSEEVAKAII